MPGSGIANRDVWPGAWEFNRKAELCLNVKFGFIPESMEEPGSSRAIYMLAGFQKINGNFKAGHTKSRHTGYREEDVSETPLVQGIGFEFVKRSARSISG